MYALCMSSQTLNLSLPTQLVQLVDEAARKNFSNRSEYIRRALVQQVKIDTGADDLVTLFDKSNALGRKLGYTTEQSVYDKINSKD
jgi:Ribbon-helix-helix protein, copG family